MTEISNTDDARITELLRRLVDQTGDHAVILLAPSGHVAWCNSSAERLFGIPREEFVGRHGSEIFTDRDREAGLDQLEFAIARADATAEDDRWHVRADGTTFWASGVMVALRSPQTRELLGFGKIIRDRTDVKTRVELLENQVRDARESAGDKDRAITQLAHELRNAMGGLRGGVELLDQPLDDEERRTKFKHLMQKQIAIVERLTQDLLDVKRAGAGKISLQCESLVVQSEVRESLARFERRFADQKLAVQILAPPTEIVVNGDRVRLQQIFGNLVENAIKYTPREGRIWIKINVDDKHALIQVEDTGRGIPHEMLQEIFELFTQVDAQTSMGGLGVGLALVRELVLLHGGSINAASKGVGQGSEFTVRLPLAAVGTDT